MGYVLLRTQMTKPKLLPDLYLPVVGVESTGCFKVGTINSLFNNTLFAKTLRWKVEMIDIW